MRIPGRRALGRILVGVALTVTSVTVDPGLGGAVEVGEPAPDFTLLSTNGVDISLNDFRGKKWVFLEFYAAAFVPT
jgi:peroxiredoxin